MTSKVFTIASWSDVNPQDNIILNGGFEVSQIWGTQSVTIGSGYYCDQWIISKNGTMVANSSIVADVPASTNLGNSLKINVTTAEASLAAGDYLFMYQPIEGTRMWKLNMGTAAAQTITIGFWTKIHRTGTYSGAWRNTAGTRSYIFTFTQNVADTWEWKTVVFPGDGVAGAGSWNGNVPNSASLLVFCVALGTTYQSTAGAWAGGGNFLGSTGTTNGVAATTDTFQITGVVLLPGTFALPWQTAGSFIRPFSEELRLCQRYYEKSYEYSAAPGSTASQFNGAEMFFCQGFNAGAWQMGTSARFKVPKRNDPTTTLYGPLSGTAGRIYDASAGADLTGTTDLAAETGFRAYATSSVTSASIARYFQWTADSRM